MIGQEKLLAGLRLMKNSLNCCVSDLNLPSWIIGDLREFFDQVEADSECGQMI